VTRENTSWLITERLPSSKTDIEKCCKQKEEERGSLNPSSALSAEINESQTNGF
jgi:hypothetical protein